MQHPVLIALAACTIGSSPLPCQSFGWLFVTSVGPSSRQHHAATGDPSRQKVVLFGGSGYGIDTWEWDGSSWLQQQPPVAPAGRLGHAMAFDGVNQQSMLFGGIVAPGSAVNETWLWNGTTWTPATPANAPPPRSSFAMVHDSARQRVVLFGGLGNLSWGSSLGDTWEWDGSNWLARAPATSPSARSLHGLAYDPGRQRVVLFGGTRIGSSWLGDTWEWDGIDWTLQTPPVSPPGRWGTSMAFDPSHQAVVMFGGVTMANVAADTWQWDGVTWTDITPAASPPATFLHALATDPTNRNVVIFGGNALATDTWMSVGSTTGVLATATSYGQACGLTPPQLIPDPTARPLIGQTARVLLTGVPTAGAWMIAGFSNTTLGATIALPLDLSPWGLAGCQLLVSTDVPGLPTVPLGATNATWQFAIPNQSPLIGMHLYLQAVTLAPGTIYLSNGVDWFLGNS